MYPYGVSHKIELPGLQSVYLDRAIGLQPVYLAEMYMWNTGIRLHRRRAAPRRRGLRAGAPRASEHCYLFSGRPGAPLIYRDDII